MKNSLVVQKKKLYEEVIDHISLLIQKNNYNVGDRLPSLQELSEMFAVGKPTLREALSVLAATGSLEIKHGSGIFIKRLPLKPSYKIITRLGEVDNEKLLSWLEFRRAVEIEAARLAAERRNEKDILAIEEAELQMEEDIKLDRLTSRANCLFHYRIIMATHNPIFIEFYKTNEASIKMYFELSLRQSIAIPRRMELVIKEHRNILESIKQQKTREATYAMQIHMANVIRKVQLVEGLNGSENETN